MKIEKFICVFVISLLVISSIVLAESEGVPKWVVNKLDKHDKDIDKLTKDIEKIWKELTWVTKKLTQHSKEIYNLTKKTLNLQEQINKLKEQDSELKGLINKLDVCPSDMVKVGDYCIDKNQNPVGSWVKQADLCGNEGKRLCSMFEWTYACNTKAVNGIGEKVEWVDYYWKLSRAPGCSLDSMGSPGDNHSSRCCK